ncbi:MAG: methionyl-tRNA formyltransferase, partial [bacterium]
CLNLHASLLPKYRGAAPIQWALINGDKETGITVMRINEGLDTGDIIAQEKIKIGENENAIDLFAKLFSVGGKLLLKVLRETEERKNLKTYKQDDSLATFAPMIKKEAGEINWQKPAQEIHNQIRGLVIWPTAYTFCDGKLLKLFGSRVVGFVSSGQPGEIVEVKKNVGFVVSTGKGNLLITEVQSAGKKRLSAYDFLLGMHIDTGKILPN